ncbi:MAG: hypothetical protein IMZ52_04800 [Actinobacteria bacterium]|nr:hypothetical protein [Actinomycetota bacterium]MBE3114785.1 hypothetical protein [Actinomycetota bacterium]
MFADYKNWNLMEGINMFNKNKSDTYKEAFLEEFKSRENLMKGIIEARMELYKMFPDKITEISELFQRYKLE